MIIIYFHLLSYFKCTWEFLIGSRPKNLKVGYDFHKKFWNIENILHWQLSTYFTHSTKIEIHYFHDPNVRYNAFECVDHNIHESFHHH